MNDNYPFFYRYHKSEPWYTHPTWVVEYKNQLGGNTALATPLSERLLRPTVYTPRRS